MTQVRIRFRPPPDQPLKFAKRASYTEPPWDPRRLQSLDSEGSRHGE